MQTPIQVNVPYPMLVRRYDDIVKAGINPEVYFDHKSLDALDPSELKGLAAGLKGNNLRATLHGPYMDLSPGGADEAIRLVTVERYKKAIEASAILGAVRTVLHAGYDDKRFDGRKTLWLEQSMKTWETLLEDAGAKGVVVAVENVFEETPDTMKALMQAFDSPALRVCLDSGHLNLFSSAPMEEWFRELGPYIAEVHVHDNLGKRDDHLPAGQGKIDFRLFFDLLSKHAKSPVITIEPHGEDVLRPAMEAVQRLLRT